MKFKANKGDRSEEAADGEPMDDESNAHMSRPKFY